MAVDIEWVLQGHGQTLGQRLGILTALGVGLQHDKLVTAEAGDQIGRAYDAGEPHCDVLQQLVADRMAERVVNLLEAIEVDKMDSKAVLAALHRRQHSIDALAELRTVGKPGKLVKCCQMHDTLLSALAFSHILENDDRAAVLHQPARHGERVLIVDRGVELLKAAPRQSASSFMRHLPGALGSVIARADTVAE